MKNLTNLFSGATATERTATVAPKVTMKSGIAELVSATPYTSNKGSKCVKLTFKDMANPENAEAGHVEYLSTADGARFGRAFDKLSYLSQHSSNEEAVAAFNTLPSPVTVLTEPVADANGIPLMEEDGSTPKVQPLVFQTNEELKAIQLEHGNDVTFVWANDDSSNKDRVAIKFNNAEAYCKQYAEAVNQFAGGKYMLDVKIDADRGFQKLVSIGKSKI
jgi:hypothetical protein